MDIPDEVRAEHARLLAVLAEARERFARDKAAFLARWHARTPLPTDCCLDCLSDVGALAVWPKAEALPTQAPPARTREARREGFGASAGAEVLVRAGIPPRGEPCPREDRDGAVACAVPAPVCWGGCWHAGPNAARATA